VRAGRIRAARRGVNARKAEKSPLHQQIGQLETRT